MPLSNPDQEKTRQEQELRIHRLIAFASGLFQGDVTISTLLESLAEGVVIIDNTGTILLVNPRAERIFDYPQGDLVGKPLAVLIPERFRKVHEEHVAGFFEKPRIRPMDQRPDLPLDLIGLHRDGTECPLEVSLSFLGTINGVFALAFVSDITLRRRYEVQLRDNEELFHVQVEGVKDYAIFMLDTKGNILNWNPGAERLKGYPAEEIIGNHFSCFYSEEDRAAGIPEEELRIAVAEGQVVAEGWRYRKDGSRFWADIIITALHYGDGSLRGFSKVTHDITGRKKVEDALRFSEDRYRAVFEDNIYSLCGAQPPRKLALN
jgi:PAS domain S-box-containing protein